MNFWKLIKAMFTCIPRYTPAECSARVRSGEALLVDVREPKEWADGVAQFSVLLSLSDLNGARTRWQAFLEKNADRELLLYCAAGGRSAIAAKVLAAEGFKAANAGGYGEWVAAGWPSVTPPAS